MATEKSSLDSESALDGYIARRNGDLDFSGIDKKVKTDGRVLLQDSYRVMGRKTRRWLVKCVRVEEIPEDAGHGELCSLPAMEAGEQRVLKCGWISESLGEKAKTPPGERHLSGRWRRIGPQFPAKGFGGRSSTSEWSLLLGDGIPGFRASFRSATSS